MVAVSVSQVCERSRVMTQVICSARTCEYNKDKICQLPVIELEESDLEWKDCGQMKERKADTPQTDEIGDCNICRFAGCSECDDCINGSEWVRMVDYLEDVDDE